MSAAAFVLLLATAAPRQEAPKPAATPADAQDLVLRVSERTGDDVAGDGSIDRPFATLKRALELHARAFDRRLELRIDLGHYGADRGETLPIRLPKQTRVIGPGSRSCEIVGGHDKPIFELPRGGTVTIEGVALRAATSAIVAPAGMQGAFLDVVLADVWVEQSDVAVDLLPGSGRIALRADGLRVAKAQTGIATRGEAELFLTLEGCEFIECGEGVAISSDGAPDDGPRQELTVRGCRFDRNRSVGLVRRGADGRNRSRKPWKIERSEFRGSAIGLSFESPGGDVPFLIADCDFVANENFGLAIAGGGASPIRRDSETESRIEDCRFRWNGVGAQVLSLGRPLQVNFCRFEDSMGTGIHYGQLSGERTQTLRVGRSLFVRNGAGFVTLGESEEGLDVFIYRCTFADNRGGGVERRGRYGGKGSFLLEDSIVSGNGRDLLGIDAATATRCLVGGDPRFVDRTARDYRPAPDSPARTADGVIGALE